MKPNIILLHGWGQNPNKFLNKTMLTVFANVKAIRAPRCMRNWRKKDWKYVCNETRQMKLKGPIFFIGFSDGARIALNSGSNYIGTTGVVFHSGFFREEDLNGKTKLPFETLVIDGKNDRTRNLGRIGTNAVDLYDYLTTDAEFYRHPDGHTWGTGTTKVVETWINNIIGKTNYGSQEGESS